MLAALAGVVTYAYVSMNAPRDTATAAAQAPVRRAPVHGYEIVREYPHDPDAFTQGLLYRDGALFESTGQYGRSSLRKVELATGKVLQQHRVDDRYFAEGLADWGTRLIQLTWQTNVGFVYDLTTFEPQSTFTYPGEGWGLTHDGSRLIMSDGSRIVFRLSGTGTEGATIRLYLERYEPDPARHDLDTQEALRRLAEIADDISGLRQRTGRDEPSVVT